MEYVNCTLSKNVYGTKVYLLTINKVKGIPCEYLICFKNREEFKKFERSNIGIISMGTEVRYGQSRNADKFLFRLDMKHDDPGFQKVVLKLEANDWVKANIDGIIARLNHQAQMFEKRKLENNSHITRF